jgi:hypothetical protein
MGLGLFRHYHVQALRVNENSQVQHWIAVRGVAHVDYGSSHDAFGGVAYDACHTRHYSVMIRG